MCPITNKVRVTICVTLYSLCKRTEEEKKKKEVEEAEVRKIQNTQQVKKNVVFVYQTLQNNVHIVELNLVGD